MIDHEAEKIITAELGPSEKLIWASRPQKYPLTIQGAFNFFFAFAWCTVFIHLMLNTFILSPEWPGENSDPETVVLIPILFLSFFIILFVNIFRAALAPMKQVYGLTQKRGIIVTNLKRKHVNSISKTELASRTRRGSENIGTLTFRVARNSHDIFHNFFSPDQGISFYNISNPREVEHLIETKTLKESAL